MAIIKLITPTKAFSGVNARFLCQEHKDNLGEAHKHDFDFTKWCVNTSTNEVYIKKASSKKWEKYTALDKRAYYKGATLLEKFWHYLPDAIIADFKGQPKFK